MESRVKVNIQNRDYLLKCNLDADYMKDLAENLNNRLNAIQKSAAGKIDENQALILVALNILDEIEMTKTAPPVSEDEVLKKTNRLISMLEKGIVGDTV